MKRIIAISGAASVLLLSACSGVPDCSSDKTKETLLSLIKENVVGNKTDDWYLQPKFEIINTTSKVDNTYVCHAQLLLSVPPQWQDSTTKKVNIDYKVQKNETSEGTFSVSTTSDISEFKKFNSIGWDANQNVIYKKAGLDFLAPSHFEAYSKKLEGNPLAALGELALLEELNFKKVHQKLLEANWKYEGVGENDKNIAIYTKDNFLLNLKAESNLLTGLTVNMDKSAIWENKK